MTNATEPLHLEYLYGPQWQDAIRIIERSGQLTAEEREKLNAASKKLIQDKVSALSNGSGLEGGLSGLLAGLGMGANAQTVASHPLNIAAATAKAFGRSRNVQLAGMIAGQAVSPAAAAGTTGDLSGLLESFGSIGAVTVVGQAVTAAVLGDLIGQGEFTQAVFDELMLPWSSNIDV
ncbi:hypothetical protein ACQPW1_08275 [Nocardia sp. CA-128927]|uniref:hypothetical protein n=1 Tax=Nocardia sp. CA-128927 TaxID=3239975 RepID=UPI003D99BE63